jgi:hypothetical protein
MKTRNKVFIGIGIFLLVTVLAGYGLVSAYGPWAYWCGGFRPPFHDRGFHPGGHTRDMAEFFLWKMDKKAKELNLTDKQKAKYEALRENLKTHFDTAQIDHQKMRDQLRKEMDQENPNLPVLVESMKSKINEMSAFLDKSLGLFLDFYNTLDSRQKRMITDEIKERMKYHRGYPEKR